MWSPSLPVHPEGTGDFSSDIRSIAVSAVVIPSRIAKLLCLALSGMLFAVAIALMIFIAPDRVLLARLCLSGCAFIAALTVLCSAMTMRNPSHIDISGQGQIRFFLQGDKEAASRFAPADGDVSIVHLQPGTLIFSSMLLLRLKNDEGNITPLLIFPDCVSPSAFRRLSVACRWIAAQNCHNTEKIHD